ncbi:MAG: hypothetical protein K8R48_05780 [Alphaproteobacteria bacterium]|nr:hypothetical protein [Alphaproteobacteria bacterium]
MHAPGVVEEKQAQFEKDAVAFNVLSPGQQRTAVFFAKFGYDCFDGLAAAGKAVMGGADWLFNILVAIPANAVKPLAMKAWNPLAQRFKFGAYKNPDSKFSQRWRTIKGKFTAGAKKAGEFFEYYCALSVYRATAWLLNPRRRSGKPLFGHETVNKIIGTGIGVCAFIGLSAALTWVEVMAKVWHAQIAQSALTDKAPRFIRIIKQTVLHPVLSGVLAATQFMAVPALAAARQALKSTKIAQGIAYQFNSKMRARPREQKPPTGWRPSTYVEKFFGEIAEKTSPEFYMARLKYFQAQRKKKPAGNSPPPPDSGSAAKAGSLELGKTFNDKAGDAPVAPPAKNTPPSPGAPSP